MINGPGNVWIEARGRLTAHAAPGLDESALLRAAIHIARPLGLDPATTPIIDARLDDGSRVAICVPPASPSRCDHHPALRQADLQRRMIWSSSKAHYRKTCLEAKRRRC